MSRTTWTRLALPVLVALLGVVPAVGWADAEGRAAPAEAVRDALARLASPLEGERKRGSAYLTLLLGGPARTHILEALEQAPEPVQQELVAVLVADAAPDAIRALVRHAVAGGPQQANDTMLALARSATVVKYLGPRLKKDKRALRKLALAEDQLPKAKQRKRLETLALLVRRAQIEALLVSRKSPSGGTGYYQGQYDVIMNFGHRKVALEVCTGIALDEALPIPGVFTGGVYDFLHPHDVDILELRGMAINAVAELATRDDEQIIARLDARFAERWRHVVRRRAELRAEGELTSRVLETKRFQDAVFSLGGEVAELSDYLLCLYLINPDEYRDALDDFIWDLKRRWRWPVKPQHVDGMVPGVLIRARRYAEAVDAYNSELLGYGGARSFIYYNLACAYASWSRDPGEKDPAHLKLLAANALRRSFGYGWRDLGWMEEDRDLDPIRDSDGYRYVVQRIKDDLGLK